MKQHVFVCYAQEDKDFAFKLIEKLEELKIPVWIAPRDIPPGADWNKALCDAILECSRFLIVLSPDAVRSKYVIGELQTAGEMDKHMVPVIHRDCEIPLLLRGVQSIYLPSIGPGTELSFKRLIDSLPHEKPSPPEPIPESLPSPPKKPDEIPVSNERPTIPVGHRIPPWVKKVLYMFVGAVGLLLLVLILMRFLPSGKAELILKPAGRNDLTVKWNGQRINPNSNTQNYLLHPAQLGTLRIFLGTFLLVDTTLALKEGQKLTYDLTGQIDSLQQMTMLSTVTFVINVEATMHIDGIEEKMGKRVSFELKPGLYQYVCVAEGYDSVKENIEVTASKDTNIVVTLEKNPRQWTLSFKVSGTVKRIAVAVGDHVKAGQLIAELDRQEAELIADSLEAQREILASLDRETNTLWDEVRQAYLRKKISQADYDSLRKQTEEVHARTSKDRWELDDMLEKVRQHLKQTRLTSPVEGEVIAIKVVVNEKVKAGRAIAVITSDPR
jgi:biotin carboxyl carrier protein